MTFPPSLSSRQMWWVGIGVVVMALVLTYVLGTQMNRLYSSYVAAEFARYVLPVVNGFLLVLQLVGACLAAGSFVVRHLEDRDPPSRSAQNVGDELPENLR